MYVCLWKIVWSAKSLIARISSSPKSHVLSDIQCSCDMVRQRHLMFSGIRFCALRPPLKTPGGSREFSKPKILQKNRQRATSGGSENLRLTVSCASSNKEGRTKGAKSFRIRTFVRTSTYVTGGMVTKLAQSPARLAHPGHWSRCSDEWY